MRKTRHNLTLTLTPEQFACIQAQAQAGTLPMSAELRALLCEYGDGELKTRLEALLRGNGVSLTPTQWLAQAAGLPIPRHGGKRAGAGKRRAEKV